MSDEYGMIKLKLNAGENQGITQFDLIQWLSDGDHMYDMNIGTVEIGSDDTVIEVKKHVVGKTMDFLRSRSFRGGRLYYEIMSRG